MDRRLHAFAVSTLKQANQKSVSGPAVDEGLAGTRDSYPICEAESRRLHLTDSDFPSIKTMLNGSLQVLPFATEGTPLTTRPLSNTSWYRFPIRSLPSNFLENFSNIAEA